MSTVKPIKRSEHLVMLSKEHHLSLLFCWKIRNGVKAVIDPGRMISYVQYFWEQHMKPHFAAEESIVFALVKGAEVEKALLQHAAIRQQIMHLDANGSNVFAQLSGLSDMVDDHVRYEERELFPYLESTLGNDLLQKIGQQLTSIHQTGLKDDYADDFWVHKSGV